MMTTRRTLFAGTLGLAALAPFAGCSPGVAGNRSAEEVADFFAGLFPELEQARYIVRSRTVAELAKSSGAVVEGRITAVRHVASSFGETGGDPLHTLGFDVTAEVVRGSLAARTQTITVVAGTVSAEPAAEAARRSAQLPDRPFLWFITAHDELAARRRHDLEADGESPTAEAVEEERKLSRLYSAGPFGVVMQGDQHADLPYLGGEVGGATDSVPLVDDVRRHRTFADVRAAARG